jgi:uracil-DNA glycosylase
MTVISESWDKILQSQYEQPYVMKIQTFLKADVAELCPRPADIWNAFKLTPFENTKVVILGQSPYHDGSAHGLAFSSLRGYPASLKVIFKELREEFNKVRESPNLTDWAEQGVLLLNTVLTTTKGSAVAHNSIGWQRLTGHVLMKLAQDTKPKVFMLWGKDAKEMGDKYISPYDQKGRHYILTAVHPAVDAYGKSQYSFSGCNHFRKANDFLGEEGRGRIKWI